MNILKDFDHPMVLTHPWWFIGVVGIAAFLLTKDFKHALTMTAVIFLALWAMHNG